MPAITASEIQMMMAYARPRHDDLMDAMPKHWADKFVKPTSWTLADFDMRRESPKQYAFYRRIAAGPAIQRYHCSHVEAKRRFTLYLITKRLTS